MSSSTEEQPASARSRSLAPTLHVKMFPVGKVARWARNPKKHDTEGLIKSMERFGFVSPPALDALTKRLYAGHGRDEALTLMKARGLPPPKNILSHKGDWWMPVIVGQSFSSEEEAEKYLVADNQFTIRGGWEMADLLDILERQDDADRAVIGFPEDDYKDLLEQADRDLQKAARGKKERKVLVAPDRSNIKSVFGEIYELGPHRVMCGRADDLDMLRALIGDRRIDLLVTDPPYNHASENKGVAADTSQSANELFNAEWDKDFDPALSFPFFVNFFSMDFTAYVFTSDHLFGWYKAWMKNWADHSSWCVWTKPDPQPSLMKRHWTWDAELVSYGTRGRHVFNFPEEGHAPSSWNFSKSIDGRIHPTQKPVEVYQHAMMHSSKPGMTAADFFAGSGPALIAGDRVGLKMLLMEKDPYYVDHIRARWAAHVEDKEQAAAL